MAKIKAKTVDEYINNAPKEAQVKLLELRSILKEVAPNASEILKWGTPVFEEKRIINKKRFNTEKNIFTV